jgi:hypothetical protein
MLDQTFFVSEAVHERTVRMPDGAEHTLYFREVSAVEFRKFAFAEQSGDEQVQAGSAAKLVAASLCEPDGKPAITYAQALKLKPAAMKELLAATLAVNGLDDAGKASPPGENSGSGTSSPSPSADAA